MPGNLYNKRNRIEILDALRGAAMIAVVIYHLMYDLIYFKGMDIPFFYSGTMEAIHVFFLIILFSVSGICTAFSRNLLRRGVLLFLLGGIITMGFSVFAPDDIIVFGVITFFGACMVLYDLSKPVLDKIPWYITFTVCVLLYLIFYNFQHGVINLFFTEILIELPRDNNFLYPLGITSDAFRSSDYFPLIPHMFMFLAGTALSKPVREKKLPEWFYGMKIPVLRFIGRHSLFIYLIHQPVFMIFMYITE